MFILKYGLLCSSDVEGRQLACEQAGSHVLDERLKLRVLVLVQSTSDVHHCKRYAPKRARSVEVATNLLAEYLCL